MCSGSMNRISLWWSQCIVQRPLHTRNQSVKLLFLPEKEEAGGFLQAPGDSYIDIFRGNVAVCQTKLVGIS